ncbi:MAG: HAMP domain-containing histidine kinase [Bacteroidetes bacterium]|nr:HAMP domain-containing histidine kinase [Bacteroidota bacterium]
MLLVIIALVDYKIGYELSSSILYLIPIYMVAAHDATSREEGNVVALISGLSWLLVDFLTEHTYSNDYIIFWNAAVRTSTFLIIALAFSKIKDKKQQLEDANTRLEAVSQEKNKYIGIAAHDIRSPLGNIFLLSQMLLDRDGRASLSPQQKEFIELINKISANALSLLNNILDISQIEAGTLRLHKENQDYISFLQEAIEMNKFIAMKKGQTIALKSEQPQLLLPFDKTYMGQALLNLLTNAVKFSHRGTSIMVEVSLEQGMVCTRVIDKGVGIRAEDIDKIFKPFQKAQNMPTGGEQSSGLGLAIVKKIVEAHNGSLGVESKYNKGTTFYFSLPLAQ